MNSIKPLITIAVLGGIGYVVYTHLNSKPSTPPPGAPTGWDSAPTVQIPGDGGSADKWGGLGGGTNSLLPQAAIAGGGAAPTFAGAPTFGGSQAATAAPTFGSAANESNERLTVPKNAGAPNDEKWGTTDPAAAVNGGTSAPVANYGDPSAAAAPANGAVVDPNASATAGRDAAPPKAYNDLQNPVGDEEVGKQFNAAWEKANALLQQGKLAEGLKELTYWHEHPKISAAEADQLNSLLDQLAGTVVYSTQHILEPAYEVKPGERLEDIAGQYNVPWQLLAKINGIDDPATLQPGEQIKVIRGPFVAVVQLEKHQLTLIVNDMYAGEFSIGIGRDMPPREGTYAVTEKTSNPVYHGRERTIEADDPSNPLGERWIALGSDMGIHGIGPLTDIGSTNQAGSISMSPRDIEDVYDILSVGSKILIVK